jgi:regulator of sirC expression with transglutaminase-like and TPR domain
MTPVDAFCELLGPAERASLPVLAAAAQLPLYADPRCEPQAVIDQLRTWSAELAARVVPDASAANRLRLLNHYFFGELGFMGAVDDYDRADNSYLHRVIERRRGIPITLSLLYMELGRAAGLRLQGVSFPGHFLVRLRLQQGTLFIDVFGGGVTLSAEDLHARLRAALRTPAAELRPFLRAAADREILARLLRNLKAIHLKARQWEAALEVMTRLVAVLPRAPQERLDRAGLYERLECPRAAAFDLAAYLSLCPQAADAAEVQARLARLQQVAARLN